MESANDLEDELARQFSVVSAAFAGALGAQPEEAKQLREKLLEQAQAWSSRQLFIYVPGVADVVAEQTELIQLARVTHGLYTYLDLSNYQPIYTHPLHAGGRMHHSLNGKPYILTQVDDGSDLINISHATWGQAATSDDREGMTVFECTMMLLYNPKIVDDHGVVAVDSIHNGQLEGQDVQFVPDFYRWSGKIKIKRDQRTDSNPGWGVPTYSFNNIITLD
jgi:hypothetical protein